MPSYKRRCIWCAHKWETAGPEADKLFLNCPGCGMWTTNIFYGSKAAAGQKTQGEGQSCCSTR
jgi:hypothetical protein